MEFTIQLRSAQDVRDFVGIATSRAFPVTVTNHQHQVNGKNFMEMFSLDVSHPLWVTAQCSWDEFQQLKGEAVRFLIGE